MITNLFSSFDPISSRITIQINWTRSLIFLIIIFPLFWVSSSKSSILLIKIPSYLTKEFIPLFKRYKNIILFNVLFIFILINNIFGLIPYTFTRTAHIAVSLTLSLTLWTSFILYGWINNTNHIFTHLVPLGTPVILIPFIVLIESIRNIIRPITLAVRLAANLTAGHLLLILLGERIVNRRIIITISVTAAQFALLTLETAVATIQAYVFATLTTLYAREV